MATAKRIRCICGKIYDPGEHACCPVCGVEVRVESISVVAPEPPGVPGLSAADPVRTAGTPPPLPRPGRDMRWVWIGGGVALFFLLMIGGAAAIWIYLKPRPIPKPDVAVVAKQDDKQEPNDASDGGPAKPEPNTADNGPSVPDSSKPPEMEPEKKEPQPSGQTADTGGGKPGGAEMPKSGNDSAPTQAPAFKYDGSKVTVEAKGTPEENGKALADAIGNADTGDTVFVRAGDYLVEGLEIEVSMHLQGEDDPKANPSQPVLQSSSTRKPPIRVTAKGVTLEKLLVMQNGNKLPALHFTKESEVAMVGCTAVSQSNQVFNSQLAASVTATDCAFGSIAADRRDSTLVSLVGAPDGDPPGVKFKFTKCDFAGGQVGVKIGLAAVGEFDHCKFHEIGLPNGTGSVILVGGRSVSVTMNECEVYKNTAGLIVTSGSLSVKGGTFSENGVPADRQGEDFPPLGGAINAGKLYFSGVTFDSNLQGLSAIDGGHLEVTDCHFNNQGSKPQKAENHFVCHALSARGKSEPVKATIIDSTGSKTERVSASVPSSLVVRGCDFSRPNMRVATVYNGAELTMEDCKADSGRADIVTIGASGEPSRAGLKKCQFYKFTEGSIVVSAGSSATFEDVELRQNSVGIEARDAGTRVQLDYVSFVGNDVLGLVAHGKSEVTARGCVFQDNGYGGVQAGVPGKPDVAATINLVECKLLNSRTMDAQACAQARITLKNCTFAEGVSPRVLHEPTGVVEADPPIQVLASNSNGNPPAQPVPAKKQTASNDTGNGATPPARKQTPRSEPSRSKSPIPEKVGEVIDAIDKIRRIIR